MSAGMSCFTSVQSIATLADGKSSKDFGIDPRHFRWLGIPTAITPSKRISCRADMNVMIMFYTVVRLIANRSAMSRSLQFRRSFIKVNSS